MRFDLYEEADTDGTEPALSWDNGQVTGAPHALADFHTRFRSGEPVVLVQPAPEMPPGADTWQQFLATAYDMPYTWDDVSGDEDALSALMESVGEPETEQTQIVH